MQGNYAFIANNGTDKLQVVDISNPTAPLLVGDINIGTFPENVFVQGNYAYITNAGNNELEIIDVSEFAEQAGVAVAVNATGATVLYPITWQAIGNDAYNLNSGNIGIGVVHPTEKLSVAGVIESTTGGIKFPDGTTQTTSATAATNDNLGNHTATQNLQLSGYWLSGDGGDEGIYINNNGNVGIGTATPEVPLHIETANDASLSDGAGILMLGDQGGANIIMDANEMMARNNGSAATLYLNFDGGNVRVGNTSSAVSVDGNLGIGTTLSLIHI